MDSPGRAAPDCRRADGSVARVRFATSDVPERDRGSWWREVICRQYAHVDITSPMTCRFSSEADIYPWRQLQLSRIASSGIAIRRQPGESRFTSDDNYFFVLLLSGDYLLEQDGREVSLRPGDMTLYDAGRPHRIRCREGFRKLILSVPHGQLRSRLSGMESRMALRIPGAEGLGAVAASFLRTTAERVDRMRSAEFLALADSAADLVTLAAASLVPGELRPSPGPAASLHRVKTFVEAHLGEPDLDSEAVARGAGLSARYVRRLFEAEDTTPMRFILAARLERCRREIERRALTGLSITDIAFRSGFNDLSHFSRRFRERFGVSPREWGNSAPTPIGPTDRRRPA